MGFARKIKRRNTPKVTRCCGMKMERKMGYDTETHDFYFCENCGKEKWVERPNCGAKMDGERKDNEA
jgi:hypothetical protein